MDALQVGQRVMVEAEIATPLHGGNYDVFVKGYVGSALVLVTKDHIHPLPTSEGWQPIATAPKDGTQIILGYNYEGYLFTCSDGRWTECNGQGGWVRHCMFQPTCWMPLTIPPPPQQTEPTP